MITQYCDICKDEIKEIGDCWEEKVTGKGIHQGLVGGWRWTEVCPKCVKKIKGMVS